MIVKAKWILPFIFCSKSFVSSFSVITVSLSASWSLKTSMYFCSRTCNSCFSLSTSLETKLLHIFYRWIQSIPEFWVLSILSFRALCDPVFRPRTDEESWGSFSVSFHKKSNRQKMTEKGGNLQHFVSKGLMIHACAGQCHRTNDLAWFCSLLRVRILSKQSNRGTWSHLYPKHTFSTIKDQ